MPAGSLGTLEYMAPEQRRRAALDPRTDIFAFGLVLLEMLTGKIPSRARPEQDAASPVFDPDALPGMPASVPGTLVALIKRCLNPKPEDRASSMLEVVDLLRDIAGPHRGPGRAPEASLRHARMRGTDLEIVQAAIEEFDYQSVARSRRAFDEIASHLDGQVSSVITDMVEAAMKRLVLTVAVPRGLAIPESVRTVRKMALALIKLSTDGHISRCFDPADLEQIDLSEMDFSSESLVGYHFDHSFLVRSTFRGTNLTNASLGNAYIRNVDFSGANLTNVDFTDSDWFNASGLTEAQLRFTRPDTLMDCPRDIDELHEFLRDHYTFPFASWTRQVQQQLKAAWREYLRPGGLRDVTAARRKSSQ